MMDISRLFIPTSGS